MKINTFDGFTSTTRGKLNVFKEAKIKKKIHKIISRETIMFQEEWS